MKRISILPFAVFLLLCALFTAGEFLYAQRGGPPEGAPPWMREGGRGGPPPWMQGGERGGPPPWMQRGGPGEDRRGRGGNDQERNERSIAMLRAMDTNRNGILEPGEIPEPRRGFVSMIVTRLGGDPNRRIDLNALARQSSRGTSGSSQRTSASTASAASTYATSTDPLVPYFGETDTATTTVPAFGQKEAAPKNAAASSQNALPALSQSDQILRSAREIMNRYDKNKNGTLDKDKGEWISSLPFKPDAADTNRDGRISMSELIAALGGKSGVTTGAAAVSTRQSIAYERIPAGMPDWFFERDKDQDGQLTMMEYANGQPWTGAMVEEFEFLDRNNDGIATAIEIFSSLKEFDEKKKLQEELAKREIERRRGAGASPSSGTSEEKPKEGDKPAGEGEKKPEPPSEPSPGGPSEKSPDWKPTPKTEAGSIPTTGPYAGESSERQREGRDGGRRGSYRRNR